MSAAVDRDDNASEVEALFRPTPEGVRAEIEKRESSISRWILPARGHA
jgi:hypothetical protein